MSDRPNSVQDDPKKWQGNPKYFFKTIAPRINKQPSIADDACIQAHIDVFGKDGVGSLSGSLASTGNFGAVIYAESSPERLAMVSYFSEVLCFYEEFEQEIAEMMGATVQDPLPRDAEFDNPVWQENYKKTLTKATTKLTEADPELGPPILQKMQELAETPDMGRRLQEGLYKTFQEYIDNRIPDMAWPSVVATAKFGANIHLPDSEQAAIDKIFWPLYGNAACCYDYWTWEKELKLKGADSNFASAMKLFQKFQPGLSFEDAREKVRQEAYNFEAEYLRRKEEYFKANPNPSADIKKWFEIQETLATGFSLWNSTTVRHHPPYGESYKVYYKERTAQGAQWFDEVNVDQPILTGGHEVKIVKS